MHARSQRPSKLPRHSNSWLLIPMRGLFNATLEWKIVHPIYQTIDALLTQITKDRWLSRAFHDLYRLPPC